MARFMLLLHESPTRFADLPPEEIQRILGEYIAWREQLVARGQLRGGEKLRGDGGRRIRWRDDGISITDGPYTEATEVLGGYFLIEADDYAAATAVASTCPHLGAGRWIEVRQIDDVH